MLRGKYNQKAGSRRDSNPGHIEDSEGWWLSGCRGSVAEQNYYEGKQSGEPSWIYGPAHIQCHNFKISARESVHFLNRFGIKCFERCLLLQRKWCNNYWSRNLIGPYHFLGISPRNSTSFLSRPFLARRHVRAGHETSTIHCCFLPPKIGVNILGGM